MPRSLVARYASFKRYSRIDHHLYAGNGIAYHISHRVEYAWYHQVKTANLISEIFLPLAIAPLFEIFIWHRLARVIRKTSKKTENFSILRLFRSLCNGTSLPNIILISILSICTLFRINLCKPIQQSVITSVPIPLKVLEI